MKRISALAGTLLLVTIGCGDDDNSSEMPPGEDLIGSWTLHTSSDERESTDKNFTIAFKRDGSVSGSLSREALLFPVIGTWFVVEETLVINFSIGNKPTVILGTYSTEGNTLTLVHSKSGVVQTYKRT